MREGALRPSEVAAGVLARIAARGKDNVWIHLLPREALAQRAAELERRGPAGLPLYGIPFAIKDNIDLAGHPTTAALPGFRLCSGGQCGGGAGPAGRWCDGDRQDNLDQFAAGLVGTRSPYGACGNSFDPQYISGGSSSGSAVAVAAGLVSFSLAPTRRAPAACRRPSTTWSA